MILALAGASIFNIGCTEDEKPATPAEPIILIEVNTIFLTKDVDSMTLTFMPKDNKEHIVFETGNGDPTESEYTVEFTTDFDKPNFRYPNYISENNLYEGFFSNKTDTAFVSQDGVQVGSLFILYDLGPLRFPTLPPTYLVQAGVHTKT